MKVVLFDVDGVLIKKRKEFFSERFMREYNAPIEKVREFFKNEFGICQKGKADLHEELEKRLPDWGWTKGTDAFMQYWFETDAEVDQELLVAVDEFKGREIVCYVVGDQEKYRAEYLRNLLGVGKRFDGAFFSYEIGAHKHEPEFFREVLRRLRGVKPQEIWYFDDGQKNVDAAKVYGIKAHFYSSIDDLYISQTL